MARHAATAAWICQGIAALILGQTLFFKFTAAEESVYIFQALGMEPWGRLGSGAAEALAVILLLVPGTAAVGALLALGVMLGALGAHLTVLGIEVQGDGGLLFGLAVVTLLCATVVLALRWRELPLRHLLPGPRSGEGTSR